jgi:hypothetical protein
MNTNRHRFFTAENAEILDTDEHPATLRNFAGAGRFLGFDGN